MDPVSSSSGTPVTSSLPAESRASFSNQFTKNITHVGNTSVSLKSGKKTTPFFGKLLNWFNLPSDHKNTIITLPAAVPLEETAILKKYKCNRCSIFIPHTR